MNCRDLREQLVQDTTDYGLVKTVSSDTLVDNGGNRWLNDGIRWLSRHRVPPVDTVRVRVNVASGAYSFSIPQCRSLQQLWLSDTTGEQTELVKSSFSELTNLYGTTVNTVDCGTPLYFCRNPRLASAPVVAPVLPQDDPGAWYEFDDIDAPSLFHYRPLNLLYSSYWSVTSTGVSMVLTEAYDPEHSAKFKLLYRFTQEVHQSRAIRFKASLPEGVTLTLSLKAVQEVSGDIVSMTGESQALYEYTVSDAEQLFVLPDIEGDWCLDIGVTGQDTLTMDDTLAITECESVAVESTLTDDYLLWPPADEACTLEGLGSVYDTELTDDADETWWTANHPDLVLRAASMCRERVKMQSESRAREMGASLLDELNSLDDSFTFGENQAPCLMRKG